MSNHSVYFNKTNVFKNFLTKKKSLRKGVLVVLVFLFLFLGVYGQNDPVHDPDGLACVPNSWFQ